MDAARAFVLLAIFGLALLIAQRVSAAKLERKIDRLAAKLDALMKASGLEPEPPMKFSDRVRKAAAQGRRIEAIKLLRQETGLSLSDAKDAVDKLTG
jgi:ribosomal protein L7/L12